MNKFLPILLIFVCFQLRAIKETEAYRSDYWLNIQLTNKEGEPLSDVEVTIKIDSERKIFRTDSTGTICINIARTTTCTKKVPREIWTSKKISLLNDEKLFMSFKNWKKIFASSNQVEYILLYENGRIRRFYDW